MKEIYKKIYMEVLFFQKEDVLTCSGLLGEESSSESLESSGIVEEVGKDIFDPGTSVW